MARRTALKAVQDHIDAAMASLAVWFMDAWTLVERGYRRPLARLALKLKFAFYPLLAVVALCWLGWDYGHDRSLNAAEDSVFDTIVQWRPVEPAPSGKTVVVEIDDCSLAWYSNQGMGGWPWPRQRHADLLDALDRAGVRAVGIDVMFLEPDEHDPEGDAMLNTMAGGGGGRFVFAASRLGGEFDDSSAGKPASSIPWAFALVPDAAEPGPTVAVQLPIGKAMADAAALANVGRDDDGVLRDVPLREDIGDWALPTLPLRLAAQTQQRPLAGYPARIRINWRSHDRLPYVSAVNLIEGKPICVDAAGETPPSLKDSVALVGYTAAGISDTKPTPVNPAMPGVEIWAEATDALLHDGAVWMPPVAFKYLLAALLILLTSYAFWRGEPHEDVDGVFVATNVAMLAAAVIGLTFFGVFIDIFASIGFVSLCFGLCRGYAAVQRSYAIGNNDYRDEYSPHHHPWLVMCRLRFAPDPSVTGFAAVRGKREYRRLLRRQLYADGGAVMIEGIVERKSWLHEILDDLMVLIWTGRDRDDALQAAKRELDQLYRRLDEGDLRLRDHGQVMVCVSVAEIDDDDDSTNRGERMRLRELLGQDLNANEETPLSRDNRFILERAHTLVFDTEPPPQGET